MSHLALLRWVRLLGTQAMLTHFGLTLFGRSPAEDEYQRKFEILIDQHLKKLMAELLLGGDDFAGLRGVYDFDEVKTRSHLLHRYCNAFESGLYADIESICEEFVVSLEKNYNTAKDILDI